MKGTIHQEEITILTTYASITGPHIYIFKILMALKAHIDTNTVIVEELNTPLSPTDRPSRQKISKETTELLHTLDKIDMVGIPPNN
jgi:hypothetical protein